MRTTFLVMALCSLLLAKAQTRYADELQLTETRFALESQIHGLKWGFLNNMDTAALGMSNQGFTSLYKVWRDRPDQSSFLLLWKPTALWCSEDGLFGLTTGPYFTQGAKDTTALANGYFFTIWQRPNTHSPFKFVVDAGVQMVPGVVPAAFMTAPVVRGVVGVTKTKSKVPSSLQSVSNSPAETFRLKAVKESLALALKHYTEEKSFLLISGYGKLSPGELGKVSALNQKIHLQAVNHKELNEGCFYEWGQIRLADDAASMPLSGLYVHVWQVQGLKPLLLAAVYKFDQALKP